MTTTHDKGSQNDEFQKETNDNKPVKVKNEHKRNLNLCDSNLIESKRRKNENFHGDVPPTPLKMKKTRIVHLIEL